ncbi:IS701 family transposase [Blastococcus capsensis]|uniref:IS701 family transposase n=1 Tax=Blastococcus capsensis TaxID=1564163 RepID=UPI0025401C2E|nr:IS701 family transposase [Blastococcus capsensis]MDK3258390.1 IS701 family transposase [Blastococcus capsensis]
MVEDVSVAEVEGWAVGLEEVTWRIGPRFSRPQPRAQAGAYLRGLLSGVERKNGWTLAEQAGDQTPDATQRLLNHAEWDADGVRDDLREYVVEYLADDDAVLVIDETGFLKKGSKSAGVARQYSGTAGRIENSQIGVFLVYAAAAGRTFIDRELYLPKAWTDDRARCAEAGIGPEVEFATKPELALRMLIRALDAEVPAGWVAGDEVYGQNGALRLALEERRMAYVLAVPVNQHVIATIDDRPAGTRVDALSAAVPEADWQRLSAGVGAKGHRLYDWARIPIRSLDEPGRYWLLVRRRLTDGELAHYLCFCPAQASLADLVGVAGRRWAIEESFETGKGEVGLDQYQVRRYDAWYRHITLACWAHAFLTVTRAATSGEKGGSRTCTAS